MNYPKPAPIDNLVNAATNAAPVYVSVPQYRKYRKHRIEPSGGSTIDFTIGNGTPGSGARNIAIGIAAIAAAGLVAYMLYKNKKR